MAHLNTEAIRNTLSDIPQETLADALALFLSDDNTETGLATHTHPDFQNFLRLYRILKRITLSKSLTNLQLKPI